MSDFSGNYWIDAVPEPLTAIKPYLHEAATLLGNSGSRSGEASDNKIDDPALNFQVAFWCLQYAIEKGHELAKGDGDCVVFLNQLLAKAESLQQAGSKTGAPKVSPNFVPSASGTNEADMDIEGAKNNSPSEGGNVGVDLNTESIILHSQRTVSAQNTADSKMAGSAINALDPNASEDQEASSSKKEAPGAPGGKKAENKGAQAKGGDREKVQMDDADGKLLLKHAEEALERAMEAESAGDDSAEDASSRVHIGRCYHSAFVYLEIVRVFCGDLNRKAESLRQFAHWRSRSHSHLIENCVHEHDSQSHYRLEDVYTLEKVLGRGSYGVVRIGVNKLSGKKYAVKTININRANAKSVSKLHEEVSIMKEMDHPSIVRLKEVFYGKRELHLVMDLYTGGDVFSYLIKQEGDHASEELSVRLVRQMLSAVFYLHSHDIAHRDLKLENFLLESNLDGVEKTLENTNCRLIDFGLSRHCYPNERISHAVGSTYYVAPEVLGGTYTKQCDMWSMGVIAYMLLSGCPPFYGPTERDVRHAIRRGYYEFPRQTWSGISQEAMDFVSKLLVVDPEGRITAAQALKHPWIVHYSQKLKSQSSKSFSKTLAGAFGVDGGSGGSGSGGDGEIHATKPSLSNRELFKSMKKFATFSTLKKVMTEVLAFSLSPDQVAGLREMFVSIDEDQSGTISVSELCKVLKDGAHCSSEDITKIFDDVDINHDHEINYNEFCAAVCWHTVQIGEERLHEVFDNFDPEGTGYIDRDHLKTGCGKDLSEEQIDAMIAEADADGDGRIDYHEFAAAWKNHMMETHQRPLDRISKALLRK